MSTLSTVRTGTPDGASGIQIAEVAAQAGGVIPGGMALSDMIANGPTAHRATVTAADTATDMSSVGFGSAGIKACDNRGAIAVWATFQATGGSITLTPVFYDNAATKAPMALGPELTLAGTAKRVSASGNYMSEVTLIETYGLANFKLFVEALANAGTGIQVYAEPV